MIVISFNTVCTEIIQLHDLKLHPYLGNFDVFEREYEERRKEVSKEAEKYVKEENIAKRSGITVWGFTFLNLLSLHPPLLQLIDVSFSYPNREDFRLSDVDVSIDMGTRVAILGPNAAGKSTLLNLLAGDLVPREGEVWRS
ncbi:hypothetical protein ACLB2K_035245 [Fragaria x ananassa]